ncbi:hypothetical protein NDU88_004529 [Pleurodeles waltl]|uniref:Uncharacterized protein n=1 Tax=Pleurodeles waltl TaxID=8319 RepID=A0AAV7VK91_PLEWA|nr:hypothetical protein NDU88_004529 [Pleurodeles waltl]
MLRKSQRLLRLEEVISDKDSHSTAQAKRSLTRRERRLAAVVSGWATLLGCRSVAWTSALSLRGPLICGGLRGRCNALIALLGLPGPADKAKSPGEAQLNSEVQSGPGRDPELQTGAGV